MTAQRILMVAGEASADRHAAGVIRELKAMMPEVEIFGMGGPEMAAAGMECIHDMDELSVMGITDVLPRIRTIFQTYDGLKRLMKERGPSLLIPVDLPDFNMRLARYAKRIGVRVLYYIAPQAWAWRRSRARTLAGMIDGLAVIFPFEAGFFSAYGVNTRYVGHPFMEHPPIVRKASWPPERIGIMPGSRIHEIERMLPVMMGAKRIVGRRHKGLTWHLPVAAGIDAEIIRQRCDEDVILETEIPEVDLAMVKSGTSTLEMALRGVPEVICYRTSPLNYFLAKAFVRVKHIGMPNIIAGRTIVPELIQQDLTTEDLARTVLLYLEDRALFEATQKTFTDLRESLGTSKASIGVATWARELLEST
ncbi:MAG: lipid-A-disaccharide synthase [Syntrophaceae bacterium]